MLTLHKGQVPLDEWQFLAMLDVRRSPLEEVRFAEIAARIVKEARVVGIPQAEPPDDPAAPPSTLRAIFRLEVAADTGDLLHNARDGLRGRYWTSPEDGDKATRYLIELLTARLLQSLPHDGLSIRNLVLGRDAIVRALDLASTKVWVDEKQLRSDGQLLEVARWVRNEAEEKNSCMWRWTPQASIVEVKTAWVEADGTEWVSEGKKERAKQIHRWGYS